MQKIIIRGRPGVGKTTLIKKLAERLKREKKSLLGFYTEEIRETGIRVGFKVKSFAGEEATMAHINYSTPYQVSRYKVDLGKFEKVALPELKRAKEERGVVIIDEIGKMELFSKEFQKEVLALMETDRMIIATCSIAPLPFISTLTKIPEIKVKEITLHNRNDLLKELATLVLS